MFKAPISENIKLTDTVPLTYENVHLSKKLISTTPGYPDLDSGSLFLHMHINKSNLKIPSGIKNALLHYSGEMKAYYTYSASSTGNIFDIAINYEYQNHVYKLYSVIAARGEYPVKQESPTSEWTPEAVSKAWKVSSFHLLKDHTNTPMPAELINELKNAVKKLPIEWIRAGFLKPKNSSKTVSTPDTLKPNLDSNEAVTPTQVVAESSRMDNNSGSDAVVEKKNIVDDKKDPILEEAPKIEIKSPDIAKIIKPLEELFSLLHSEGQPKEYQALVNTLTQLRNETPAGPELEMNELSKLLTDANHLKEVNDSAKYPDGLLADEVWSEKEFLERHMDYITDEEPYSSIGYLGKLSARAQIRFDSIDFDLLPKIDLLVNLLVPYLDLRLKHGADKMKELDPDDNQLKSVIKMLKNALSFIEQLMQQDKFLLEFVIQHYERSVLKVLDLNTSESSTGDERFNSRMLVYTIKHLLVKYASYTHNPSLTDINALPSMEELPLPHIVDNEFTVDTFMARMNNLREKIKHTPTRDFSDNPLHVLLKTFMEVILTIQEREKLTPSTPITQSVSEVPAQAIDNSHSKYEEVYSPINQDLNVETKVVADPDDLNANEPFDDLDSLEDFDIQAEFCEPNQAEQKRVLEIAGMIGQGDFGIVYRGKDQEKDVAVKHLYNWASISSSLINQFGMMMSDKPYGEAPCEFLVRLYGSIVLDSRIGIVMEHVPQTLSDALHSDDEPLTWEERYNVSQEIIAGLFYLHAHEITHGNLKTHNVLMTDNGHAKVGDYGLSIESSRPRKNSLQYTAPEMAINHQLEPNKESDMFSLGVVLWEILKCEMPFNNLSERNGQIDDQIKSYWKKTIKGVNNVDHFPLPPVPPKNPAIVNKTFTLLAPMIRSCRQVDPKVRPNVSQLMSSCNKL
jgi:hypothetical protein